MNAGTDPKKAFEQAWANAKLDGRPRYVHLWNGSYWIRKDPPGSTWAGVLPENVTVVYPAGHTAAYQPPKKE